MDGIVRGMLAMSSGILALLKAPWQMKGWLLVDGIGRERPAIFNSYWPCKRHIAGRDDSWWMKYSGIASGITKQYTWKAMSGRLQCYCDLCDSCFKFSHHMKKTYLVSSCQCPQCGKCFISWNGKQRQMKYHVGDNSYLCALCVAEFISMNHGK